MEMIGTMYLIVAFGLFLAGLFEGEKVLACVLFGMFWPITLAALVIRR